MRKPATTAKTPRRSPNRPRSGATHPAAIAAALKDISQIEPSSPRAAGVIALLKSWLNDESGYDEETWPKLKKALEEQRERVGARRLFDE